MNIAYSILHTQYISLGTKSMHGLHTLNVNLNERLLNAFKKNVFLNQVRMQETSKLVLVHKFSSVCIKCILILHVRELLDALLSASSVRGSGPFY